MDKKTLIAHLNEDLAGELGAIIQYLTYAAKSTGPYRPQLSQFFLAEVVDEQGHASYLANKIVAMGGEPTTTPRPTPAAKTNREMLQAVLAAEQGATRDYTQRALEAEELGDGSHCSAVGLTGRRLPGSPAGVGSGRQPPAGGRRPPGATAQVRPRQPALGGLEARRVGPDRRPPVVRTSTGRPRRATGRGWRSTGRPRQATVGGLGFEGSASAGGRRWFGLRGSASAGDCWWFGLRGSASADDGLGMALAGSGLTGGFRAGNGQRGAGVRRWFGTLWCALVRAVAW